MAVIPFPRPATKSDPEAVLQLETVARGIALSVRFARPIDAARWARSVSEVEFDAACAADDVLLLIDTKRMAAEASRQGDTGKAMRLQAVVARLYADLHSTGQKHRIRGWRQ